jgi:hypothetical protein
MDPETMHAAHVGAEAVIGTGVETADHVAAVMPGHQRAMLDTGPAVVTNRSVMDGRPGSLPRSAPVGFVPAGRRDRVGRL